MEVLSLPWLGSTRLLRLPLPYLLPADLPCCSSCPISLFNWPSLLLSQPSPQATLPIFRYRIQYRLPFGQHFKLPQREPDRERRDDPAPLFSHSPASCTTT